MRIVIDGRYIQDRFPGIGRYTYNLINSLGALGTGDEIIVIINPKLKNQRYNICVLSDYKDISLINCDISRRIPAELFSLAGFVNRLNPDLYHSPFYVRPYSIKCPCVITLYDLIPLDYPSSKGGHMNAMIFRMATKLACRLSSVITISETSAQDIRERFKVASRNIHPILLAPAPNFNKQTALKIQQMRQTYSLYKPYILHVGSHLPHKNVKGLISAWAKIKT